MASPDLACNFHAIGASQWPRYNNLVTRLRSAMRDHRELPDGYIYLLDSTKIALAEVSEWITMERLCCPFLIFQLEETGKDCYLTMRGPDGAKAVLREEFGAGGQDGSQAGGDGLR
jgi:hypothetical protein